MFTFASLFVLLGRVYSVTDKQVAGAHLLLGKEVEVVVDAILAEDFSEEVPAREVCLEGVDHLAKPRY